MTGWIVLAVLIAAGVYAVLVYNRLVASHQMAHEGWSGIEVQLKRRADLIPNLIEAVKGYMGHERETLERVTELRALSQSVGEENVAERARLEGLLGQALGRLMAVAENYPELKASANFLDFQNGLEEIESEIQMARRYYNGTVRRLNTLIDQFPSNLVARAFRFAKADYFELDDEADRAVPKVSFAR